MITKKDLAVHIQTMHRSGMPDEVVEKLSKWDLEQRHAAHHFSGRFKKEHEESHICGPLCPEHGDPRDTNMAEEFAHEKDEHHE